MLEKNIKLRQAQRTVEIDRASHRTGRGKLSDKGILNAIREITYIGCNRMLSALFVANTLPWPQAKVPRVT
jgi:hypothetical protein